MQVDMNFIDDVRVGLAADLQELGYGLPPLTGHPRDDAHRVCVDHWNASSRRIAVQPRSVHKSRELRAHEQALAQEVHNGLAAVEQEIRCGADLTARLSRRLPRREFHDLMLNDWGIQHLHLDAVDRTQGTRELLFVIVRPDHIYFIDVRDHGAWADSDLVEIIHNNWPALIERYRSNAQRLSQPLTDEQRRRLRSKRTNSAIQTNDGTVYHAMGGGYVASGANIKAVRWGDYMLGTAKLVEDFLRGQTGWIAGLVEGEAGVRPDRVTLRLLQIDKDHALVLVENAKPPFAFRVPIDEPPRFTIEMTSTVSAR